jgi:membrane dipeptidase
LGRPDISVKFFDAHCDTVLKVMDGSLDFQTGQGVGHVSFPQMLSAGSCAQVFACFVLSEEYPGMERERAESVISRICEMVSGTRGQMQVALTSSDLHDAFSGGPIAALISLEGADPLEGRPETLRHFYQLGVRDLILAWQDNPFSGTAFGADTSLTSAGEALVELSEELRVMVDVSHLSDRAFDRVCQLATHPFIASHSNCRALCPNRRNLSDSMIRVLAGHGGMMGINLSPMFLDPDFHRVMTTWRERLLAAGAHPADVRTAMRKKLKELPRPPIDWAIRHVCHAIDVGGEDSVGLGGDLDGSTILPDRIEGIGDYPKIVDGLYRAGLSTRQVEKVCYQNFKRVFCEVLPAV